MSEFAIQVKHLDKMYKLYNKPSDRLKEALGMKVPVREHYALRDVSFDVKRGETVGIIGTNGSGKSTILKIITGVLNPTGGEVTVDGRISALLELGAGFNMEYTGIENVYLNGTMMGFSKEEIDARLQDILDFADIGDFVHQPVKAYSSGMFVRLAFAVAINIDPEILIVDEALSVGDVFFQAKCYRKFEEFKKMGRTILFVSHDLSSISRYCDRVILLNKGVKLEEGSPKQMVDMYKQLLVGQDPTRKVEKEVKKKENWSEKFQVNPNMLEYGSKLAEITDFVVMDTTDFIPSATISETSRLPFVFDSESSLLSSLSSAFLSELFFFDFVIRNHLPYRNWKVSGTIRHKHLKSPSGAHQTHPPDQNHILRMPLYTCMMEVSVNSWQDLPALR